MQSFPHIDLPVHVLVTGGAGFIGSHLCERLLNDDHSVTIIDSFDDFYAPSDKRNNIAFTATSPRCRVVECDILDQHTIREMVTERVDVVVHLAARAGVRPSLEQPLLYTRVNVEGTAAMLEFARLRDIKRFVFGSSSSVYGNSASVPFREDDRADAPISPYAASKRAGELLAHSYSHLYGMSVAALRFFTVYGPRQRPDLAIHKFARRMLASQPISVFGDGSMRRDFTYIDDIVDGIIRAIEWTSVPGRCEIFNLGESETTSVVELVALIEEALGRSAVVEWLPEQPGDVRQTFADVSKARHVLGYSPSTSMRQGLAQFAKWLGTAAVQRSH